MGARKGIRTTVFGEKRTFSDPNNLKAVFKSKQHSMTQRAKAARRNQSGSLMVKVCDSSIRCRVYSTTSPYISVVLTFTPKLICNTLSDERKVRLED